MKLETIMAQTQALARHEITMISSRHPTYQLQALLQLSHSYIQTE